MAHRLPTNGDTSNSRPFSRRGCFRAEFRHVMTDLCHDGFVSCQVRVMSGACHVGQVFHCSFRRRVATAMAAKPLMITIEEGSGMDVTTIKLTESKGWSEAEWSE